MNILTWIVFGLIVGLVANVLDPHPARGGLMGSIILGILGALLGGFLGDLFFGPPTGGSLSGFNLSSFIVAVIGALVLLFAGRIFRQTTV